MATQCFENYKAWVGKHGGKLGYVEQLISKCIWLLPNRFSESEVGAEACQSLLGLVRVWHESLIQKDGKSSIFTWSMALEAIQQVCCRLFVFT